MSDKPDISNIKLTSYVFPTAADMKLWDSLKPEEQAAVIWRDIDEGLCTPSVELDKHEIIRLAFDRVEANNT